MNEEDVVELITESVLSGEHMFTGRIETYEEAGVLTRNKGLVIRFKDGTEFQVQVVQSR